MRTQEARQTRSTRLLRPRKASLLERTRVPAPAIRRGVTVSIFKRDPVPGLCLLIGLLRPQRLGRSQLPCWQLRSLLQSSPSKKSRFQSTVERSTRLLVGEAKQRNSLTFGLPYDGLSIMHYESNFFSIDEYKKSIFFIVISF